MDLTLLETLKERLVTATEFSKVWEYFLDHFGENPQFMALGDRTRNTVVEKLLIETAKKVCKIHIKPSDILLTGLPEQHFLHGGYCKNGQMINVLFFEDDNIGTIMICALGKKNTITMRFSAQKVKEPAKPSLN